MIKLKDILKEEMSSSDKRDMKSSTRNIDFHIGYINGEIKKLVKMLNKEGMKKSSRERLQALATEIRNTQKLPSTKFFEDNQLPFELFLRLSMLSDKRVVEYGKDLEEMTVVWEKRK